MSSSRMVDISQGRFLSRPHLFLESNFTHWTRLIQIWVIDQDEELCNIVLVVRIMHTIGTKQ